MNDTPPEIRKKQLEIILSKTPEQRAKMGMDMMESVYKAVKNSIIQQNPHFTEGEVIIELFRRYYRNDFTPEQLEEIITHMKLYWANKK